MQVSEERRARGSYAYHGGKAAEVSVEKDYKDRGYSILARRWRGKAGEIDLIFGVGAKRVFVEVKKSKSFDAAALRISTAQIRRLFSAAQEYLADAPDGQLTEMRFDVALVNSQGAIEVLENALLDA